MSSVKLGDALVKPSKILCVGRNYLEHIQELNNSVPEQMVVFSKPPSSIASHLSSFHQERLHYEGEICFIVKQGKLSAVGVGLDLTKRDLQSRLKEKGLPWERAKAFDGSAVFSRFVPLVGFEIDSLEIELFINCVRVQKGSVKQMIYSPAVIVKELKSYTTLCDGDIIMTGTPQGVGEVHADDVFLARLKSGDKTLIEIEWVAQ
ncbi:fumarylacetoacetate hydrolase family protein [Vibrio europaeus]|uniref:Fumarylacetoacetate hydrolase family protein n=1 Tax=Vibrio europaeus TaxID=300876 RepID=A0AAE7B0W3_9VIBR|nr:fumarylacetoacetate hydrolase family protein [Vibrio europaeus]MDC5805830.1 fumarylacetoacetate hydrolase family protein [Vibrio europaeus]MDC5812127.1 fumarylacetoacetate hydrolase family protein [Vibrio europaeus]MDC5826097.1 fumarylacetoacetate hydrolase family protein [Vibrio europaeus]MDC5831461.1 fumarylacetoacetate hydrolase family protein [Vibrio europaeus]MDC5834416.1 fumarylacetoacetate hydrolase family protein [Vibrio europaeus]